MSLPDIRNVGSGQENAGRESERVVLDSASTATGQPPLAATRGVQTKGINTQPVSSNDVGLPVELTEVGGSYPEI